METFFIKQTHQPSSCKQLFEKFELVFIKVRMSMTKSKNFNNLTKIINDHR